MNSTRTVVYDQSVGWECLSGSGDWTFGEVISLGNNYRLVGPVRPLRRLASLALLFVASSLTSAADPWAEQQRERAQVTVASASRPPARRRLSPFEARRIALDILYRAESSRELMARAEAARGINWEEVA